MKGKRLREKANRLSVREEPEGEDTNLPLGDVDLAHAGTSGGRVLAVALSVDAERHRALRGLIHAA